jgi:SM-20-related protein
MLNPSLDRAAAAARFTTQGRVQLRDFLEPATAQDLHRCLEAEVPWGLTYTQPQDGSPVLLQGPEFKARDPRELETIHRDVTARAGKGFAFHYSTYMMVTAYRERRDPGLGLHRVMEFLNTPTFLDLIRGITGAQEIRKANAQATRYSRGDFLTWHTDGPNRARKAAYVINLARDWREEWGGLLQFSDRQDPGQTVAESYVPVFNSLSLFRVPAWHQVSRVSEAAPHARYAVTGWVLDA